VRLRRITRSPIVFWIAALALAVTTGLAVSHLVGSAAAEAARYGSLRRAVVALHALAPGDVVEARDVETRAVPVAFLPRDALTAPPTGRTVVVPVFPGQALVQDQVAPHGLRGVAALLPRGARAVALPVGKGSRPPVHRGDVVDVLATFDPDTVPAGDDPTFPVASGALVVDVAEESVTVAVRPEDAARVAFAVASGTVTLAVAGV